MKHPTCDKARQEQARLAALFHDIMLLQRAGSLAEQGLLQLEQRVSFVEKAACRACASLNTL